MTVLTRVAALVVAVGLVVAAVLVRAARDEGGSAGRGGLLSGDPASIDQVFTAVISNI